MKNLIVQGSLKNLHSGPIVIYYVLSSSEGFWYFSYYISDNSYLLSLYIEKKYLKDELLGFFYALKINFIVWVM